MSIVCYTGMHRVRHFAITIVLGKDFSVLCPIHEGTTLINHTTG